MLDFVSAANLLLALSKPIRLRMLSLLIVNPGGLCGKEISARLAISETVASSHLRHLEKAGLVKAMRVRGRALRQISPTACQDILEFSRAKLVVADNPATIKPTN